MAPLEPGLLVANHLSYLDILVLGAMQPMVFIAKSEVRSWPVLGWLACKAGTVFIRRDRRSDLSRVRQKMEEVVAAGLAVAVFPEGTTTDGSRILPFHPGLFQGATENAWPVTPVWLAYEMDEGCVGEEVCYWGDMSFPVHFLNLLTKRRIVSQVRRGSVLRGATDRRALALAAHSTVSQLSTSAPGRQRNPTRAAATADHPIHVSPV